MFYARKKLRKNDFVHAYYDPTINRMILPFVTWIDAYENLTDNLIVRLNLDRSSSHVKLFGVYAYCQTNDQSSNIYFVIGTSVNKKMKQDLIDFNPLKP